mgnify:CR=1 FL=1
MNQTRTEVVAYGCVMIGGGLAGLSCAVEQWPAGYIVL